MQPQSREAAPDRPRQAWEESPAPALVLGRSGSVLAGNRAFRELIGRDAGPIRPDLVRDGVLVEPTLEELFRPACSPLRLRLRLAGDRSAEFLAAVGPAPEEPEAPRAIQVVLIPAGPCTETERALRRELHRLEDLLAGLGRPEGADCPESWQGAAQGLLEELPGPGVLLDRSLKVVWPLQEPSGPPVLCAVHLLGSPGRCPACLAARALAERRPVSERVDGALVHARPLPGGFILEWRELEPLGARHGPA